MHKGRQAAAAAVNRHKGGHILDVGIGTGLELPMFDPSLKVVGVDLSAADAAARGKARATNALHLVEGLGVMDACRLAFPDASFDAIVAPFVLTVLPEPEASLDEWLRVLKPGGEIILVNHIGAEKGPIAMIEAWLADAAPRSAGVRNFPGALSRTGLRRGRSSP